MVAGVAATMLVSVIATCASSLYYCSKAMEYLRKGSSNICDEVSEKCVDCIHEECRVRFRKENRTERESKNSRSPIVNEQQDEKSEKFSSVRANRETITSTEWKRGTIFPSRGADVVPVRPPRRHRKNRRTSEDAVKDESSGEFSSIESRRSSTNKGSTDTSSVIDNDHGVRRVKVQIESCPRGIASPSKKIRNSLKPGSPLPDVNRFNESDESTLKASRECSFVTSQESKNDSSKKVATRKTINTSAECEGIETEGSNFSVPPPSSSQHPPCKDRSMMFQINRMVNASTSTKISSYAHELKEFDSEEIASVQEIWKSSSCSTEEYDIAILKEVLSFLSHEEKDCALELSTSRTKPEEERARNASQGDDSHIVTIQIRKYHRLNDGHSLRNKPKSFESRLTNMNGKLSDRVERNDNEGSSSLSRSEERSKTRLSSLDGSSSLSSTDRSSYYTIRLSAMDQAIFEKKNRKKGKASRMYRSKKLSKIFQCQKQSAVSR
ncbi:hypothetical protein KPH14_007479 [Odynerus spinipes]|uniref:Uncharacterized protein n=1 Tax=Odynerus spinipes TaxID=1348599 RepID=A0AAD9VIN3_9HYME|nr:hypothetical protein KPH14_007479 [Odynerus spinipes]